MALTPDTIPVSLDAHRRGVIRCGTCGLQKPVQLPPEAAVTPRVRIKIKCGQCQARFDMQFDSRRAPRLAFHIHGMLFQPGSASPSARVIVTSLSPQGLGLTTAQPLGLRPGAEYKIVVVLHGGAMRMDAITMRWCHGTQVGALFRPSDPEAAILALSLVAAGEYP